MKVAAAAALGEMPIVDGCTFVVLGVKVGVKEGESTLSDFFWLSKLSYGCTSQQGKTDMLSIPFAGTVLLKSWL